MGPEDGGGPNYGAITRPVSGRFHLLPGGTGGGWVQPVPGPHTLHAPPVRGGHTLRYPHGRYHGVKPGRPAKNQPKANETELNQMESTRHKEHTLLAGTRSSFTHQRLTPRNLLCCMWLRPHTPAYPNTHVKYQWVISPIACNFLPTGGQPHVLRFRDYGQRTPQT